MVKILFVDDRPDEVIRQWQLSGCANNHEMLPLEPFSSIERTCRMVDALKPDLVLIGYGLGKPDITGADVINSIRQRGYSGYIIANSGGGTEQFNQAGVKIDGTANRNPHDLKTVINNLTERR